MNVLPLDSAVLPAEDEFTPHDSMTLEFSDHELMIRVREGEIDCLGELFERNHRALYGFFVHLTAQRTKVDSMDQLVAFSLAQRQPAQTRLQRVLFRSTRNDDAPVARLLGTVDFDPNTNVRLSALETLDAHASNPLVNDGILNALPRESSPIVQLAMINFLTSVRDRQAGPIFEDLARTTKAHEAVRTAAQLALSQL